VLGLLALSFDERRVLAWVPVLASLAAGAVVGGAVFELIPDALASGASRQLVAVGIAAGVAGFWFLERGLRWLANHRASSAPPASHPIVTLNVVGDLLHNGIDGVIIAAAFLATPAAGFIATLAIVLHEIPRELGSFGIFMHGGLSVRRAVVYNAVTGVAAMVGAALTLLVGTRAVGATRALLPIAAGTFLYLGASLVPGAILAAPSTPQRMKRLALAVLACAGTAAAAHLG
jgi:zinc and cadmium transporter